MKPVDGWCRTCMAKVLSLVVAPMLLAACGQGGGNNPPVADAGPDQKPPEVSISVVQRLLLVQAGDTVLLDGSASSDPEGDTLTYAWSFDAVPANSDAALSDPAAAQPSFVADQPGTYVARLTVNDGTVDSAPDTVSVTVVIAPPNVTITAPENLSVVTSSLLTLTGTVDDPGATLTVNKSFAVDNNDGDYATNITLAEGSNSILVVGQNSTGTGSAGVTVILDTSSNPALTLTTPNGDFTHSGGAFPMGQPFPASNPFHVRGVVKVTTTSASAQDNKPAVTVNGVAADVFPDNFVSACSQPDLFQCWGFTASVPLAQGSNTIDAIGTDVQTRSTTASRAGVTDYCRIGVYDSQHSTPGNFDPGQTALAGPNHLLQNNRCHEIDGCSAPDVTQQCADNPMQCPQGGAGTVLAKVKLGRAAAIPANSNQASTAFGQGAPPPTGIGNTPAEYFIHGFESTAKVPCNRHDTCYQTCVPRGASDAEAEAAWKSAWHECNARQKREMLDVCNRAYPARCPFRITVLGADLPDPTKCPRYSHEKETCTILANVYYQGVESEYAPGSFLENQLGGQPSGFTRFKQRQADYCAP
jgi:hypothetical protein